MRWVPNASIVAFEANPDNAALIKGGVEVRSAGVRVEEAAAWNETGTLTFHVTAVDRSDPQVNIGTSSIQPHPLLEQIPVQVSSTRVDDFVLSEYPHAKRIALWTDVEGAEAEVIEGMNRIIDRVTLIHVETADVPMHIAQRTTADVMAPLSKMNMMPLGSRFDGRVWGDLIYIVVRLQSPTVLMWQQVARGLSLFPRRRIADFLYHHTPHFHRLIKHLFCHSVLLTGY